MVAITFGDTFFNRIITYQMVWIKVNQTQLAVDSLQLPQDLFLKVHQLLDQCTPPFSLPGGPVVVTELQTHEQGLVGV